MKKDFFLWCIFHPWIGILNFWFVKVTKKFFCLIKKNLVYGLKVCLLKIKFEIIEKWTIALEIKKNFGQSGNPE